MGTFNSYEETKILKHEEELKKKMISNQLKQAGNFFVNHFSVLSPKFSLAGSYEEKLDLYFPNPVPHILINQIKHEILEQGKFLINYFADRNTFRITIPEEHLSSFKSKKFNFNQPKFKIDTTVAIEKAVEIKPEILLAEEVKNPQIQTETSTPNQNTNQNQENEMSEKKLQDLRGMITAQFKTNNITALKNYTSIVLNLNKNACVINCKTANDASVIVKLLTDAGISKNVEQKEGKKTVWVYLYGVAPAKKTAAKKTVVKKTTVKKTAAKRKYSKKAKTTEVSISDQLRGIASILESQKAGDPDSIFTKLVGDGELMVRTKDKRGNEVLKNISKEKFLTCFK